MKINIEAAMQEGLQAQEARERDATLKADDSNETIDEAPLSYEETERKVLYQWSAGAKLEAMETVLGRRIDARALSSDPNLSRAFMLQDPNEAFGALLMLQKLENSTTDQDL